MGVTGGSDTGGCITGGSVTGGCISLVVGVTFMVCIWAICVLTYGVLYKELEYFLVSYLTRSN